MKPTNWRRIAFLTVLILTPAIAAGRAQPRTSEHRATRSNTLGVIVDPLIDEAVAKQQIPGAVLLVGHNGHVVYRKAYGWRSLEPVRERMTVDTIFDLASLTKCVATTMSVMRLMEKGLVRLNDPVAVYLPEFAQNGKAGITVRELLTHFSGLAPDLDLQTQWQGRETAFRMAMEQTPAYPPGARFVYSDINFEVLGFLVEKISGTSLDDFAAHSVFEPLGMSHTRFLPPEERRPLIAPTQNDEQGQMLRGVVHDPTARRMGGVAGHAGLFSTADDLARFAQELLSGSKVLSRAAIEKMTTPQQPANAPSLRGLGWDIDSPFATNRGELLPVGSFGHTGFTGTSLWIDPVTDTYIVLLTNAVHAPGGGSTVSLRSRVATAVAQGLALTVSEKEKMRLARITGYNETLMAARRLQVRNGAVKNGIDVLEQHRFRELHPNAAQPVRVGLLTNQTGIDAQGRRTVDLLAQTPGLRLTAIFTPEHGIEGKLDTTEISNARDAVTGIPIYSVYGATDAQRRPDPAVMAGLDLLVVDLADAGVRFYTYESTLGYFLEAARKAGEEIVVLDRPNPLTGAFVQGPIRDADRESFVGYGEVPVRHGMTMGELARLFNAERGIGAQLTVIPMEGWMRGDWFDSTGEIWTNPSPNLRDLTEATLYPGVGTIETTNVSVGRGTDTPFELVGAPWIAPEELARDLNAREIAGVRFIPVHFIPASSLYAGQVCGGVSILLIDRDALDAPEMGLEIAAALRALYPEKYDAARVDTLMVNRESLDALLRGDDPRHTAEAWQDAIVKFEAVRAKYLLY